MGGLEIIVLAIFLIFALKGMKQGLILTVCSFLILFLAIVITQIATPQISSLLRENENIVSFFSEQVETVLFEKEPENNKSELTDEEKIGSLSVPKTMKKDLLKNNTKKKYEEIGAANFREYTSIYIAYSIINSITYILVFLAVSILLKMLMHVLNLISKLPVVHTLNKLGGMGIGLIEGLIIVWIGFVVITILSSTYFGIHMLEQINESVWLSYIYDNNIILNTIANLTNMIF